MRRQPFADRLIEAIVSKRSFLVVGLDPRLAALPAHITETAMAQHGRTREGAAAAIVAFNRVIIEAVAPFAVAVKPQLAFYEVLGAPGLEAFAETVRMARAAGLLVIADGKRNDIGSTAEAYAEAYLGTPRWGNDVLGEPVADALTVNPYMGSDSVQPFVAECERGAGIFVLVRTSNPSAAELQDLAVDERPLFERVAYLVDKWGASVVGECGFSAVGAVVGATYPEEAAKLRALLPKTLFLVPGVGAQGGSAADAAHAFASGGLGAVVNASRSILFAFQDPTVRAAVGSDIGRAAAWAASRLQSDLNQAVAARCGLPW